MSFLALPNETREALAGRVADHLLEFVPLQNYWLLIFHDCRKRSAAGECPVRVDWHRKNVCGIKTKDSDEAKNWIVKACLAGYTVFRCLRGPYNGTSPGSLDQIFARKEGE